MPRARRSALALCAALVIVASLAIGSTASAPPADALKPSVCASIPDAIYAPWVHPLVVADGNGWWVSSISSEGQNQIHKVACGEPTSAAVDLGAPAAKDDHNAAALALNPDQPTMLAFASLHGPTTYTRLWSINRVTHEVSAERHIEFGARAVYAQVFQSGDHLSLIARVGTGWSYVTSNDWGENWDAPRVLIDGAGIGQNYLVARAGFGANSGTVALAFAGHPHLSTYKRITVAMLDLASGEITTIEGTSLGNLDDPGGPAITPLEMDQAVINPMGVSSRLLDLGQYGGKPVLVYAVWKGTKPASYLYRAWTGTRWMSSKWKVPAGREFGYRPDTRYIGGAALTATGIITSRQTPVQSPKGLWRLEEWKCVWTSGCTLSTTYSYGYRKTVRPYVMRDGDGTLVMAISLKKYRTYTDYSGTVFLYRR
jgi:hypothetical protein